MKFKAIETKEDILILEVLASKIWKTYWSKMTSKEQAEYMFEKFQSKAAIEEQISNGQVYKILSFENKNVGYFSVLNKCDYLFLSKIYVDERHRGKGFGKIMFKNAIDIAKELNLSKIRLNVNKYNFNTIRAYENWGFKIVESIVIDIEHGFVMDDYIMEFDLAGPSG